MERAADRSSRTEEAKARALTHLAGASHVALSLSAVKIVASDRDGCQQYSPSSPSNLTSRRGRWDALSQRRIMISPSGSKHVQPARHAANLEAACLRCAARNAKCQLEALPFDVISSISLRSAANPRLVASLGPSVFGVAQRRVELD